MKHWLIGLALAVMAAGSVTPSFAGEYLSLDYRDQEFGGYYEVQLKRDLQYAYPQYRFEELEVRSIQVETKLFDRSGDVSVRVGRYQSERRGLYGNPREFHNPDPRTYAQMFFSLPPGEGQGPWLILLNGTQFKVRRVTVEVERAFAPPPQPYPPQQRYMELD